MELCVSASGQAGVTSLLHDHRHACSMSNQILQVTADGFENPQIRLWVGGRGGGVSCQRYDRLHWPKGVSTPVQIMRAALAVTVSTPVYIQRAAMAQHIQRAAMAVRGQHIQRATTAVRAQHIWRAATAVRAQHP